MRYTQEILQQMMSNTLIRAHWAGITRLAELFSYFPKDVNIMPIVNPYAFVVEGCYLDFEKKDRLIKLFNLN